MTRVERIMGKLINRGQAGFMRHEIIAGRMKKSFMLMQTDSDAQTPMFANSVNTQEEGGRTDEKWLSKY